MASKAQWAAVQKKIDSLTPSARQSYYEMMADEADKPTAFKTALALLDMKGTGTVAKKKPASKTAKATPSKGKRGKRAAKKAKGQMPLALLKKRLVRLSSIVKQRGG